MTDKTFDQPTGMNELREKLAKLYADSHEYPSLISTKWPDVFAKEAEAAIQQIVERCLPARDTRKHACPGADEHIQIGYNAAIDQFRHNLQQAGLLRGAELTQKPAEETEAQ